MRLALAALALGAACSKPAAPPHVGKIVVAITVDWEGAYLSPDGLDAIDDLRSVLGNPPITHFVSAAYFTKAKPDPQAGQTIAASLRPGDELALHLHAWKSIAVAAKLEPKLYPSFLTGNDQLLQFEDGDIGFDTDLDVYSAVELRALLRTSRQLLEAAKLTVSTSFRAGGYLATPKVLQALHDEGFAIDSSATDYRKLVSDKEVFLSNRLKEVWPRIEATSQPYAIPVTGGTLVEAPIAAIADYTTPGDVVAVFDAAHRKLVADKTHDVVVVLAFHQETADEFARRLGEALTRVRSRADIAGELQFTTVSKLAVAK